MDAERSEYGRLLIVHCEHDVQVFADTHDCLPCTKAELTKYLAAYVEQRIEKERLRAALHRLVSLKDGPKDSMYLRDEPLAWEAARAALSGSSRQVDG
jgi:hypothetical protein